MFRFTLKKLFVGVAIVGMVLATSTQIGMGTATFEIWENDLSTNERGLIQGVLKWGYTGPGENQKDAWPFICRINNIANHEILKLKPKMKNAIRYRMTALGPLKKQDQYKMYISRALGISEDKIKGFVMLNEQTEIVIDGS